MSKLKVGGKAVVIKNIGEDRYDAYIGTVGIVVSEFVNAVEVEHKNGRVLWWSFDEIATSELAKALYE